MKADWLVREYTPKDKRGVFALRDTVYGEPFNEQEWDWKYESEIVKKSKIFLAESAGKIVGLRPIIFLPLKVADQVMTVGLNVDVMTHPGFARRGIFSTLVREAFNNIKKEGVDFVFTFPNENSYPGYIKLGWTHICSIPLLAMPLKPGNIVKKYVKFAPFQAIAGLLVRFLFGMTRLRVRPGKTSNERLVISQVNSFNEHFDELWRKCSRQYNVGVVRDTVYLNWRYANKPGQEYVILVAEKEKELAGYIVLKSKVQMFALTLGLIVDILTTEVEGAVNILLSRAIEHFKEQKVDIIGCLMLKHTSYYKALKKAGFIGMPKYFSPKRFYFVGHTDPLMIPSTTVYNVNNWYLTFGDIDIV